MRDDVHARRVVPDEKWLAAGLGLVDEIRCVLSRMTSSTVSMLYLMPVDRVRRQRAFVDDLLLADLAPARIDSVGSSVSVAKECTQVARTDRSLQVLRVVGIPERVLHRVEVIEIAEELVEAVHAWQIFVAVAEMVLAELPGGVAHRLQRGGDGRRLCGHADVGAGLTDGGQAGADRQLAGDEIGAARGAARLRVVVGEQHALGASLSRFGVLPAIMPRW